VTPADLKRAHIFCYSGPAVAVWLWPPTALRLGSFYHIIFQRNWRRRNDIIGGSINL